MSLFDRISGTQSGDDEEGEFGLPSYLVAADSHSIANNNQSFMEGAAETISNIPKFIGASLISGANEIYNIAPSIGNFMGGDFDISKTADVVSSIDEDLGVYYKEHQESVDIAGFLVGSLVPGMAGVKLLNAGQKVLSTSIASGRFGKNMSSGLGLLVPSREKYLKKAIEEITNSNSLSLLTNKNTMLAMASGYGQGILEAAAFEIAVASTMSASPILENQDLGDIMTNIAVGGIAFGTIVGVVDITKSSFALKKAIKLADKEAAPVTNIKAASAAIPTSSKIVYDLQQAEQLKSIDMERFPAERRQFLAQSAKTKAVALDTQVRTNLGELAGGDQVIADQAHMMTRGADLQTSMGNYLGATKISRIADLTPEEALLKRVDRKLEIGSAKIKDVEAANAVNFKASYTTSWGEGIGNTTPDLPKHITLSDTLKKSESIVIENNKLIAGKNSYALSMKGIRDDARLGAAGTTIPAKGTGWNVKTSSVLGAQARHMLAIDSAPFVQGKTFKAVTINENDTPLLDKLYREFSPEHKVLLEDGTTRKFADASELLDFIHTKKVTLANEMVASPKFAKVSQEDIASMLNMRSSRLSGEVSPDLDRDIFALQSYADEYSKLRAAKGLPELSVPVYKLPRTLKVSYDTSVFKDLDGNLLEGIAVITQQERIHSQKIDNIFASYMADDTGNYIEIGLDKIEEASRIGSGPGLITAASENYGSLAADAEWVGKNTIGTIDKKKAVALESLSAPAWKMAQSQKATVEFSTLNARLRALPDNYTLNEAGDAFELEVVANYKQMLAEGKKPKAPVLNSPDSPAMIPIENIEAREMAAAHIAVNGKRSSSLVELRTAQGVINRRNPKVFYPTPVDPKDFPFFALVVDNSITGTGHHSTIYANSNEQLEAMITKVKSTNPTFEVHTKGDAERYYRSIGQYDQSRSLNENYMDHALKRSGVSSPHFIATDPQKVTQDLIDWHMKQEASVVREFVSAKYERQFGELAKRGDTFTDISTSQFNNLALVKHAENVVKNPYMDYIKTMLGIKNYSDYPFWTSANKMLDNKVSEMYDKLTKVVESSKSVEELGELNGLLRKYGYKGAAYDMEMDLLANHSASKHVLQNFVQTSNGVLATVVLRLDAFNAVTNALSANILYGAEMTSVLRAIEKGDSLAVGELAALGKIKVPGTDKLVLSPLKIYSNAIKAFGKDSPDLALFNKLNITTSISKQYRDNGVMAVVLTFGLSFMSTHTVSVHGPGPPEAFIVATYKPAFV